VHSEEGWTVAFLILSALFLHILHVKLSYLLMHATLHITGKGKVVPLFNDLRTTPWRHIGEWRYLSTILDLGTRWRWVVRFTAWPLYPLGKRSRYPLDRRLRGPQSRSGRCGVQEKSLAPAGNPTPAAQPIARRDTDWATFIRRFPFHVKCLYWSEKKLIFGLGPTFQPHRILASVREAHRSILG
jgi:hypothetical protein